METLQRLPSGNAEAIYKAFNNVIAEIDTRITSISQADTKAKTKLLEDTSTLNTWVIDMGPNLSSRDQENYARQVGSLQARLREFTNSKRPKFKFTKRPGGGKATILDGQSSASSAASSPQIIPPLIHRKDQRHLHFSAPGTIDSDSDVQPIGRPPAATSVSRVTVAPDDHSVIADEVGKSLDLPSSPGRPVTLDGLHKCVIRNWCNKKIPALYLRKIRGCVIDGGWVEGSVFVEDVADSIIFVRGRQVRVHASKGLSLVIDVRSKPIIEDCENISVIELDREWIENQYGDDPGENCWGDVQDFKWHKMEASPNWKAAPDKPTIKELDHYLRNDTAQSTIVRGVWKWPL